MRQLFILSLLAIFVGCKPESKEFIFPEGIILNTIITDLSPDYFNDLLSARTNNLVVEAELNLLDPSIRILQHGFIWNQYDSDYYGLLLPDTTEVYNENEQPAPNEKINYINLGERSGSGRFSNTINLSQGLSIEDGNYFANYQGQQINGVLIRLRAYAVTDRGISYGDVKIFHYDPLVSLTINLVGLDFESLEANSFVNNIGFSEEVIEEWIDHGLVWKEEGYSFPSLQDNVKSLGSIATYALYEIGDTIIGLEPGTNYLVRSYLKDKEDGDVWYSQTLTVTTADRVGWFERASFPGEVGTNGRSDMKSFSIGNKGYVGFGVYFQSGSSVPIYPGDLWEYDTENNSWARLADFPGDKKRNSEIAFSIGNKAYYGMGSWSDFNGTSYFTDLWEYDPELDTWSQITNFPGSPRWRQSVFVVDDIAYIGGGVLSDGTLTDDFWSYDGTTSSWSQIANILLGPISDATTFSLSGKGFVGMGEIGGSDNKRMVSYDPVSNIWTEVMSVPDIAEPLSSPFSFSIVDKGYVSARVSSTIKLFEYNPIANSWIEIPGYAQGSFSETYFSSLSRGYAINREGKVFEFNP